LLLLPTVVSDAKLLRETMSGFGLGRLPTVSNGSAMGDTDLKRTMSPALLEGVMSVVADWGAKGLEALSKEYMQRSGEPWLTQNALAAYAHVWLLEEALEMAGKPERHAVNEALHKMDITDGPARLLPGGRVRFDAHGRRIDAGLLVIQWQDGKPVTVYPPSEAVDEPRWPR
jgi:branched-chain amino acid transport system substrate-binding protein